VGQARKVAGIVLHVWFAGKVKACSRYGAAAMGNVWMTASHTAIAILQPFPRPAAISFCLLSFPPEKSKKVPKKTYPPPIHRPADLEVERGAPHESSEFRQSS
jgi:hypothetical protein